MMSSLTLNNQLRLQGNARYAMIGLTSGAILNIFLDALFIYVFDMGVMGSLACHLHKPDDGLVHTFDGHRDERQRAYSDKKFQSFMAEL